MNLSKELITKVEEIIRNASHATIAKIDVIVMEKTILL